MTDLTRARQLIALAKELGAKATAGPWSNAASRTLVPELASLLAEQIAATEAAEAKLASAEKVVEGAASHMKDPRNGKKWDALSELIAAHDASAPKEGE